MPSRKQKPFLRSKYSPSPQPVTICTSKWLYFLILHFLWKTWVVYTNTSLHGSTLSKRKSSLFPIITMTPLWMGDCLFSRAYPDHAGKQQTGGTLESLIDHTCWTDVGLFHPRFPFQPQPVERGIFHKGEGGKEEVYGQGIGAGSDLPSLLNKLTRGEGVFKMSNRSVNICIIF